MKQPLQILFGFLFGTVLGLIAFATGPDSRYIEFAIKYVAQPAGQIFLRLIFMIVVPLVFSSLILGVYELKDFGKLGRVGMKTLLYTVVASLASVVIGLVLVGTIQPGKGIDPALKEKLLVKTTQSEKVLNQASSASSLPDIIVGLIPKNPISSAANALDGEMVGLMFFALIFGAALIIIRKDDGEEDPLIRVITTIRDASMVIVNMAMKIAPYGVAGLMFSLTAKFGWELLMRLGVYVSVVVLGLLIQQFVVYGALLKFYAKKSPIQFLMQTRDVILTAFSTASSNATLPTSLRVANDNLKLDKGISSFVLTVGSTANQNGTALFEGVTILFLAQVFGVDLNLGQQFVVLLMSVVAGIGTAGVPGGSIPLIVIVLKTVGVPPEGIGIILGVDRFLDMSRTVINVTGDLVAAVVVDKSEKGVQAPAAA